MLGQPHRHSVPRPTTATAGPATAASPAPVGPPPERRSPRALLALLAAALLAPTWAHREPAAAAAPKTPNPWFFLERAYPLGHIPLDQWRAAQRQAAALRSRPSRSAVAWTPRGPDNVGGRITELAVDPTDEHVVYAGAAEGGVLRTTDGGLTWATLFDDMPSLAIGAVAVDPSNPAVVWAGTGEVNPGGGSVAYGGTGLYRSTDHGDTWAFAGLAASGSIGRIRVDPTDPDRVLVAAMGHLWQTNPERGVYRTTDGGASWERVLYVDDQTGCVDLVQRSDAPGTVFAAMWRRLRQPEYYDYGGATCAVHRSTDGGDTWEVVGGGLPTPSAASGRIGISLCQDQPDVMHAIYADNVGYFAGLYRSTDGGLSWARTADSLLVTAQVFASYGWWFGNVRTHPSNPDWVYVLGLDFFRSTDGGASYVNASGTLHVDHHALEFGPGSSPRAYLGNDGGVYGSTDGGATWAKSPLMPITQAYRVALDAGNPAALYVGSQDTSTVRTLTGATDDWQEVLGGDGFQALVHPTSSSWVWGQMQYGAIYFSSNGGSTWLGATVGIPAGDRTTWNAPLVQDPTDPDLRYCGTYRVWRSTSTRNWVAISPDLTGGPHSGSSGQVDGTLTTLAVSPLDPQVIWAGSNDGFVQVTTDGGSSWADVSGTLPERWVTAVRADPRARATAWVAISGYRWVEPLPHVFRTTDLGLTWQAVAGNLPEAPVNDLLVDPFEPDRLFVATDVGVFETLDGGASWSALGAGLPNVVAVSLALEPHDRVLVVGTFGRSLFSTPVELDLLFFDGVETGDTSRWSSAVGLR